MSYLTHFWKFYHHSQKILEKQHGFELAAKEMISYLDVIKKEAASYCPRPCSICSDSQKCEFVHSLVVFGDRMLINHFGLSSPLLEPHYYGTHIGIENFLDNASRLIEIIQKIDKKQWTDQHREIAYVHYYILQYLNRQKSMDQQMGFAPNKEESLFGSLTSILRNVEYNNNLTPLVYKTIQEEDRIVMLPSLWHTVIWFATLIIALIVLINALWYSHTEEIRKNLKDLQKMQISVQGDKK